MSALVDLIRAEFKRTGTKPVMNRFFNEIGCCGIGVLFKNTGIPSIALAAFRKSYIVELIKTNYNIETDSKEIEDTIRGWDSNNEVEAKFVSPFALEVYNLRKELECQHSSHSSENDSKPQAPDL